MGVQCRNTLLSRHISLSRSEILKAPSLLQSEMMCDGATTVTGSHCTYGRSRMRDTMSSADGLFGSFPARCCFATASRLIPSKLAEMVSLPNEDCYIPGLSIGFPTKTSC